VRLKLNQVLLVDRLEVYDWFRLASEACGLVPGTVQPGWSSYKGEVWQSPDASQPWNPPSGQLIHELRVIRSPMDPLNNLSASLTVARPMVVHMALGLPEDWAMETIDLSHLPFNTFFRDDPVNAHFKDHLATRMADLLAAPPLL